MPRITSTYSKLFPGEEGEYPGEENGWLDEEGVEIELDDYDVDEGITIAQKAAKFLRDEGATEPSSYPFSPGTWYSTGYDVVDYSTGEEEERSFHLEDFLPDQEREIYQLVTGRQ